LTIRPNETARIRLRLTADANPAPFADFAELFAVRKKETDEFYDSWCNCGLGKDEHLIQRQAFAGLLWTKQLYYYDVEQWLAGDPADDRGLHRYAERNKSWQHLTNFDIISMPDSWEFPWYAAWDLAFHCVPFVLLDPDFAKRQLELMTREWYMHPNGQLPAYEWSFSDANPPVHALATWRVYKIDARNSGEPDIAFLESVFHKLLLNFTWWVNRQDTEGNNIFQGGFLGLDNIGVFDRSKQLPRGGRIDQADGTSWMASYCLFMLRMSLELSVHNPVYQESASKFLEHFLRLAHAMTNIGSVGTRLWDDEDGFFYDVLHLADGTQIPLKVRSLVGLIPLLAVDTIEPSILKIAPDFHRRLKWFVINRPHLSGNMARIDVPGAGKRRLVALVSEERLKRVLNKMFDENEFLSDYGIRSLSRYHEKNPYSVNIDGAQHVVAYEPGESTTNMFGGNSNWRGPVWIPMNFLFIEALQKFHHYYGDSLKVEFPTGSGVQMNLGEAATELSKRVEKLFAKREDGSRPCMGPSPLFRGKDFQDYLLFHEYFHPETGQGLGASHQTGWTALIAKLLQQTARGT
jgi:hypothetical protein